MMLNVTQHVEQHLLSYTTYKQNNKQTNTKKIMNSEISTYLDEYEKEHKRTPTT